MGDYVKYADPCRPTLEELLAKRDAGLKLFGWEKKLVWSMQTKRRLLSVQQDCTYCRMLLTDETATIDHIIPVSKGGENVDSNAALACESCNQWKGNDSLADFRRSPYYRWIKGMSLIEVLRVKKLCPFAERRRLNYLNFQVLMFNRSPLC